MTNRKNSFRKGLRISDFAVLLKQFVQLLLSHLPDKRCRRLLLPLGIVTCCFLVLEVLDTELVIPLCSDHLLRQAEDVLSRNASRLAA